MKNNCSCGRIAVANCTSCEKPACSKHIEAMFRKSPQAYGRGKTLAEAAWQSGYWQNYQLVVCPTCREEQGDKYSNIILAESKHWSSDTIVRAMIAISKGYVATDEFLFPIEALAKKWISLKVEPAVNLNRFRKVQPSRMYIRDRLNLNRTHKRWTKPKYGSDCFAGWTFAGWQHVQDNIDYRHSSITKYAHITTTGEVFGSMEGQIESTSLNFGSIELLIAMAGRYCKSKRIPWNGPQFDPRVSFS